MGWSLFRKSVEADSESATIDVLQRIVDVTLPSNPESLLELTISINETPGVADRFGSALCMMRRHDESIDTTGSIVPVFRHPNSITREQFSEMILSASKIGQLIDGFIEVQATVDLEQGTVLWLPEAGAHIDIPHLDQIVENAIYSLVETNIFGEWFTPTAVSRRATVHSI